MESGAFVVNATGWLTDKQRAEMSPDESLIKYLKGGICTGIVVDIWDLLFGIFLLFLTRSAIEFICSSKNLIT